MMDLIPLCVSFLMLFALLILKMRECRRWEKRYHQAMAGWDKCIKSLNKPTSDTEEE